MTRIKFLKPYADGIIQHMEGSVAVVSDEKAKKIIEEGFAAEAESVNPETKEK